MMPVASAEAPILAMLLPSSSAPISRLRMLNRPETTSASRLPCFDSRSMLAREAPVSAVSLSAKKPDAASSTMTTENVIQSMTPMSLCICTADVPLPVLNTADQSAAAREPDLQEIADLRRIDIFGDHGAADRFHQNKSQLAALDLLVLRHQRQQPISVTKPFLGKTCNVLQMRRQADTAKMVNNAFNIIGRQHAELGRKLRREHHADRNALAMEQTIREAGDGFQRVAEGVAEIEQRAIAGLALVAGDDRGLGAAGGGDGVLARRSALDDVGVVGLEPGKEAGIAEQAVFGHFSIAGAELAR